MTSVTLLYFFYPFVISCTAALRLGGGLHWGTCADKQLLIAGDSRALISSVCFSFHTVKS